MKNSQYNIFIDRNALTVCYNAFTDSMLILKKSAYEDFVSLKLDDFSMKHLAVYKGFIDKGFLIPEEMDELAIIRQDYEEEIHHSRTRELMIYPTQDCNLKCWYCYENHVRGSIMSADVQENIIQYVRKLFEEDDFDAFKLSFFGGEPLIDFNKIAYPISLAIKKMCDDKGTYFSTLFISNATLITESVIDKMKDINPHFQITLDGNKEKHNTVRIGKKNGFPTYDKIMQSIHLIANNISNSLSEQKEIIVLRINYDNETLRDITDIIDDIKDINREIIYIHLERVWQTMSQVDAEQVELLIRAMRLFSSEGFYVDVGKFKRKSSACLAEVHGYAIINYDGLVYKCNGRNLTKETSEGRLNEDGDVVWDEERIQKRMQRATFDNPYCLKCKMLPLCMGPCSQKCMELGWDNLEKVCLISLLDFSLEQYILLKCETRWKYLNYKNPDL